MKACLFPFDLASCLFFAISKVLDDNQLFFFFFGIVGIFLFVSSLIMSRISCHNSSGSLPIRLSASNLFFTATLYLYGMFCRSGFAVCVDL